VARQLSFGAVLSSLTVRSPRLTRIGMLPKLEVSRVGSALGRLSEMRADAGEGEAFWPRCRTAFNARIQPIALIRNSTPSF
jgi:hypothetical protein